MPRDDVQRLGEAGIDLFHYAGHAFFDPDNRARSGLVLHGEEVLIGTDIASLPSVPRFVFLNACESNRVRRQARQEGRAPIGEYVSRMIGLAEAFIVAGVSNMVGTIWPVLDRDAGQFAAAFYRAAATAPIGEAIVRARNALHENGRPSWLNYIHYGDPDSSV